MSSTIARRLPRVARASRLSTRRYASAAEHPEGYVPTGEEFIAQRQAVRDHAKETTALWRRISIFVCVPGTIIMALYVKKIEDEHAAHMEHELHEHGGEKPEAPSFSYLNRRTSSFPWGNNSLFFNPKVNKDMNEAE